MDLLDELEAAFDGFEEKLLPPAPPPAGVLGRAPKRRRTEPRAVPSQPTPAYQPIPYQQRHPSTCQEGTRAVKYSGAAAAASAGTPTAAPSSPLLTLSEALLLNVLSKMSPDDLLALGSTSRYMRQVVDHAADQVLWRRLYLTRWPDGPQQEEEHVQGASWKVLYLERDHQAVLEAQRSAPSKELLPLYLQMAKAKRSEALNRADADSLYRPPVNTPSLRLSSKVDAFRRQRGLMDVGKHSQSAHTHNCPGGCSWAQLDGNAWICEKSGFVHVCSADCGYRELDPSNDMQVCTISGRCFAHMLTDREEHAGDWERGQGRHQREQEEEGWGAEEGMGGRLGRAFYAGYNAESPEDFFRSFGFRF